MTIRQTAEAFPAFSEGGLRWLAFNRAENGLAAAVIRVGRRLLVDEAAFVRWLEAHREVKATSTTKPRPTDAGGHR